MTKRLIFTAKAADAHYYTLTDVDQQENDLDPYNPEQILRSFHELKKPNWVIEHLDRCIVSICRYYYPGRDRSIFVSLSAEGDVGFIGKEEGFYEKIPGAGLHADDADGYGYMNRIRQIGPDLYACGLGGQVYRRVSKGRWQHMDAGLLQPAASDEVLMLEDINGTSANQLYTVANNGLVFFFDGSKWTKVAVPTVEWLHAIYVESPDAIWICGRNGTLLKGNRRDGFSDLSSVQDNETFLSVASFQGKVYLGHQNGLSVYDGQTIQPVSTGLRPDVRDGHLVDAVDGVLWSFGYGDIARFDGAQWTRYPTDQP